MKFIITAGGQGTKVWPLSREEKPKQFQEIIGDTTLFSYQIETLLKGYSTEDIFISTKHQYVKYVVEQAKDIKLQNIIVEPDFKKNRGPGEGYAILKLNELHANEPFMIVQSDCLRKPEERFLKMISVIEKLIIKDRKFITGGQKALTADMGSDYLMLGDKVKTQDGLEVFKIEKFIERLNDYKKTTELIENFHVSTHTNHNAWYTELFLNAYEKYRPDWFNALMQIRESFGKPGEKEITEKIYSEMQEGSTEEVTKYVFADGYVVLLPFKWTDIGTWGSIFDYFISNGGNYSDGDSIMIDTKSTLVKSKKGKIVATIGVEDLVIVDTDDVLLVCKKNRSGDVKEVLGELKKRDLKEFM